MGEEAIDHALLVTGLEERPCVTKNLRIHGWLKNFDPMAAELDHPEPWQSGQVADFTELASAYTLV